jgi:cytochrome P450
MLTNDQMESIRLNHPLGQLVKTTAQYSQSLKVGSKVYTIPAGTAIHLSLSALHTHPRYWGEDGMKWNPKRFISIPAGAPDTLENEVLVADTSDHFLPWAYGQRVCPGKRFSQVELVAALAMLFHEHSIQPEPQSGETLEEARARVFKASLQVEHEGKILNEMSDPQSTCLKWSKHNS